MSSLNIAIDGPVGCGKSTLAKRLAERLALTFLDTGAMYRAVALYLSSQKGITSSEEFHMGLLDDCVLAFDDDNHILLGGEVVEDKIRTPQIGALASEFSKLQGLREFLVRQQQDIVKQGGYIAEGRDIGTHVMPDASLKIYLTAELAVRAKRRFDDYVQQGISTTLEEVTREVQERDERDMNRSFAPLQKTDDAIEVDTSAMSIEDLVSHIEGLYRQVERSRQVS